MANQRMAEETAAERDQLKQENERLRKAIGDTVCFAANESELSDTQKVVAIAKILRAALHQQEQGANPMQSTLSEAIDTASK